MDDDIKLPGSSFDEVSKIIQAYAHLNKEASLDEVSRAVGMNNTTVSRNNGFLVSVGVISGGLKKTITPTGRRLGHALSHGLDQEVQTTLRELVGEIEFLRNLVGAVRIRKGMDDNALRSHVAYSAGVSKTSAAMTGAATVVELLKRSGAIEEVDGKFLVSSSHASEPVTIPGSIGESAQQAPRLLDATPASNQVHVTGFASPRGVSISIEIQVRCTPDELDSLGKKLRNLVDEFEQEKEPAPDEASEIGSTS